MTTTQEQDVEIEYPPRLQQPIVYPYSVTLQQMAKGARVEERCYNTRLELAIRECLEPHMKTRRH